MPRRIPLLMILATLFIASGYIPTLWFNFDFIDDGNLVYGHPGLSLHEHVELWWERVVANFEHLGPFRPVLWAHWELSANLLNNDPLAWRLTRWCWCILSTGLMLSLLRILGIAPVASFLTTAAAMWNPYRNDIWTSLTLAEGVAMPYAMLALIAAKKATTAERSWPWDLASVLAVLAALGCKNTYVALIPVQVWLRLVTDGPGPWINRSAFSRAVWYFVPLLLPLGHFVYFKLHPMPGHYAVPGPSGEQLLRILGWVKGAAGLDCIGLGLLGLLILAVRSRSMRENWWQNRSVLGASALLLLGGVVVYLPMPMMTGRYTVPAVWGFDCFLGLLLTGLLREVPSWGSRMAWGLLGLGLAVLLMALLARQEKLAARSDLLWDVVHACEVELPSGSTLAWVSDRKDLLQLNPEEGIHVQWHLQNRQRNDVRIQLVDLQMEKLHRVELPAGEEQAEYRMGTVLPEEQGWQTIRHFERSYRLGGKVYRCILQARCEKVITR